MANTPPTNTSMTEEEEEETEATDGEENVTTAGEDEVQEEEDEDGIGEVDLLKSADGTTAKSKGESSREGSNAADGGNDQLEMFRQQWQSELQQRPGSRGQSPRGNSEAAYNSNTTTNKNKQAVDKENEARAYFLQGMQSEDDGMLTEAIYYYRKALQLVPDIESKLGGIFNRSPREKERQDSTGSLDESEMEEDLMEHFEKLKLKDEGLCQTEYEQKMTHISCLPTELVIYILQWVVSTDLDLRSLETFSLVCRGFYMCARDERVWKKACARVWGSNLGGCKKFGGSWRKMMIERPHLLFDGCYISKVTYVRQGEQGMDSFYRPFHLVEYYRYVRFFPDGQMLMMVSPEDPLQSLPKLKHSSSRAGGILKGGYKLSEFKVTCALKRVKTESVSNNKYRRHRQQVINQNDSEMTYCVEFDVLSSGRRTNTQLAWVKYEVHTRYKSSGVETQTNFDLNKRTFPPLIFSRVKSYTATSREPLM